jgi:glycerate 2-kinase
MAGKTFINYRRDDDPGFTHAICMLLETKFGPDALFMDVGIKPGDDFVEIITSQVGHADVVLSVIGPRWLSLLQAKRNDPNDFVVLEIRTALEQGKRIIPILVGGAAMPLPDSLPAAISAFSRRTAIELRPQKFRQDCLALINAIRSHLALAEQDRRKLIIVKSPGDLLSKILNDALGQYHPDKCLLPFLPPAPQHGSVYVIGAGVVTRLLAEATEDHYVSRNESTSLHGCVALRMGEVLRTRIVTDIQVSYPVPTEPNQAAAKAILNLVQKATKDDIVICLLSPGATRALEYPVSELTQSDLSSVIRHLLRGGASILELNTVRSHLTRLDGGRLLRASNAGRFWTFAVSYGIGADGPLASMVIPDPSTLSDCHDVLDKYGVDKTTPVYPALWNSENETLKPNDRVFDAASLKVIADPAMCLSSASEMARARGYRAVILSDALNDLAKDTAKQHADMALRSHRRGERTAFFAAGELCVARKGTGRGSPALEYVLALSIACGQIPDITALAVSTQGSLDLDGYAGAALTPQTLQKARDLGLDPLEYLENNDSFGFFQRVGGLISIKETIALGDFFGILIR